jgi:hypothetical protein
MLVRYNKQIKTVCSEVYGAVSGRIDGRFNKLAEENPRLDLNRQDLEDYGSYLYQELHHAIAE